jgi:hypothetical protein
MNKGYLTTDNGHAIPIDDEIEHIPYDWCECEPELWQINGRDMWLHDAVDQRNIVDQAEAIRTCISFDIFQDNKHTYELHKMEMFPFTDRTYFVWPRLAMRNRSNE